MSDELPPEREKALRMILEGSRPAEIAEACGVTTRSIRYWKADPLFRRKLDERREENNRATFLRLSGMQQKAADAVQDILEGKVSGRDAATKLQAANLVFDRTGVISTANPPAEPQSQAEAARSLAALYGLGPDTDTSEGDDEADNVTPLRPA